MMKKESILSDISLYLILLFSFSFSVFPKALPIIIALFTFLAIVRFIVGPKETIQPDVQLILLIGLYLLYLTGILWSTDIKEGNASLETMFSLFLFPILFMINREFFKTNLIQILLFFIFGCLVSVIAHLTVAFWESTSFLNHGIVFNTIDPNYASWDYGGSHFRYTNLSPYLHPSYYSAYLILAAIASVLIIRYKALSDKYLIGILKFSVPIFLIMIYLLSSKAGIFCAVLVIVFYSVFLIRENKQMIHKIIIVLSCLAIVITALQNSRFNTLKEAIRNPHIVNDYKATGSVISRIHIWKAAIEVISGNFFLGVGTGDTSIALDKKYEIYQYKEPLRVSAHAHNQFLEVFVCLGIIGFLLLLTVFIYPVIQSIRQKNIIFLLFIFIIFFNYLFESMLNRMSGSIFFSFFYCLLSITNLNGKEPSKIKKDK